MKNNVSSEEAFKLAKERLADGKSFAAIRSELSELGMEEGEIKYIIRQLDNELLKASKSTGSGSNAKRRMIIGAIIMLIGVVLAIYTWVEQIRGVNYYLMEFGALFIGYYFFRSGYMQIKNTH